MTASQLGSFGGVFAVFVFWHFFADWVFQTNKEALAKARDWRVRARHCTVYTVLFWPLFLVLHVNVLFATFAHLTLFFSHFIIDTYVPVMLWAKYLRRAPEFAVDTWIPGAWEDKRIEHRKPTDEEAFKRMAGTPIGLLLIITLDQFFHIAFLLPVAYLMVTRAR